MEASKYRTRCALFRRKRIIVIRRTEKSGRTNRKEIFYPSEISIMWTFPIQLGAQRGSRCQLAFFFESEGGGVRTEEKEISNRRLVLLFAAGVSFSLLFLALPPPAFIVADAAIRRREEEEEEDLSIGKEDPGLTKIL